MRFFLTSLILVGALFAAPVHAVDYLSNYYGGGYYPYGGSVYQGYDGPGGYVSNPHRSSWEGYLRQQQRMARRIAAAQYRDNGVGIYNPMGITLGWPTPRVGIPPCGVYVQEPAYCRGYTPAWRDRDYE